MSWFGAVPAGLLMLAVFFLPGVAILLAARLRWQLAVPVAPAISVAVASIGALVAEPLNIKWNLLAYTVTTLIVAAVAFGLGRLIKPNSMDNPSEFIEIPIRGLNRLDRRSGNVRHTAWWAIAGVAIAAPIAIVPLAVGFGQPDAPALSFDAIFHLNALRHILETGDASTLSLGGIASPGASLAYYPAGWHDIVSVALIAGSVTLAANVSALVIAAFVYPIGLTFLAATVFPKSRMVVFLAPILGSGFVAFPARMFTYGTLWPSGLATALLPALLALVVLVFSAAPMRRQRILLVIVTLLALAGASFAHPTALFATVLLTASYLVWRGWRIARVWWRAGRYKLVIGAAVMVPALLAAAWVILPRLPYIRGVLGYPRTSVETHAQAIGEALFDSMLKDTGHGNGTAFWLMGALTVVGFILLAQRTDKLWLLISYAASVAFYALAAGPDTRLRGLVGLWYKDPVRLGGLVPIFATLIASFALAWLTAYVVHFVQQRSEAQHHERNAGELRAYVHLWVPATSTVVVVAIMFWFSGGLRADERKAEATREYTKPLVNEHSLLSAGELEMIKRLESELPADAVVLGNPKNGSALVYALTGRHVLFAHIKGVFGAEREYVAQNFHQLNTDPRVCQLLSILGATHFYDDSDLYGPGATRLFDDLSADGLNQGLELIDQSGTARVYEITACG